MIISIDPIVNISAIIRYHQLFKTLMFLILQYSQLVFFSYLLTNSSSDEATPKLTQ